MAQITDWLSFDYTSGASGVTEISASTAPNNTERNRTAIVEFENEEGLKKNSTIIQYRDVQGDLPVLNPTGDTVYKSGGTTQFWFTYNNPFYVSGNVETSVWYNEVNGRYDVTCTIPESYSSVEKDFVIYVVTPFGSVPYNVHQLNYNPSITFSPESLTFPTSSGGSSQVIVTSLDLPWSASPNDDWISMSQTTGQAGQTIITISAAPLNDIDLLTTYEKNGTITFTNGEQSVDYHVKVINDTLGTIDDDWVTCTYYITETGDTTLCYSFDDLSEGSIGGSFQPYKYVFMDDEHGSMQKDPYYTVDMQSYTFRYHAVFTTTGYHTVKFRFSRSEAIPARAFPDNDLVFYNDSCFPMHVDKLKKVVIGDRCTGFIGAYGVNNPNVEEIILGRADHLIYCKAFASAGSLDHNFILTSGATIENVCGDVEAFDNFKANMFIMQQDLTGGINYGTLVSNYDRYIYWYKEYPNDTAHTDITYVGSYTGTTFNNVEDKHFYTIICNYFVFGQDCVNVGSYATYRYRFMQNVNGVDYENYNPQTGYTTDKWLLYVGMFKITTSAFIFLRKNAPEVDAHAFGEPGVCVTIKKTGSNIDTVYRSATAPFSDKDYWYPADGNGYGDIVAFDNLNEGHTFTSLDDIFGD